MPNLTRTFTVRARAAAGRARSLARNAEVRLSAEVPLRRYVPGLLSVVVPVYNVEAYLDECLASLRRQDYRRTEIIVVDDGSTDGSHAIARRHQRRDPRIRVVRRTNGGLSAARNTGVASARGEFLAFVDSDDMVTEGAYRTAVSTLQSTGSDFAVLQYQRLVRSLIAPAAVWIRAAHASTRLATTLGDYPDILVNSMICSKVFRREFWDHHQLAFVEGIIWEDQQVTAEAYARAGSFDVLTEIGYTWRIRADQSSITQSKRQVATLRAQFDSANESIGVLRRLAGEDVMNARLVQLLRNDMPQFTSKIADAENGFWDLLRDELPILVDQLDPATYERMVPAQHKVLNHLIVAGERERAEAFLRLGGLAVSHHPVRREQVGLVACLPTWRDPSVDVPDRLFLLDESQTPLRTSVRAVRRLSASVVEVRGWAYIENVDLATTEHTTRAWLTCEGQRDVPLVVVQGRDEAVDETSASEYADYRSSALAVTVDTAGLTEGVWTVVLEVTALGTTRRGVWKNPWPGGAAQRPVAVAAAGGRAAVLTARGVQGLAVDVFAPAPVVTGDELVDGALTVLGAGVVPTRLVLRRDRGRDTIESRPVAQVDGSWRARFDLRREDGLDVPGWGRGRHWSLTAETDGAVQPVRFAPSAGEQVPAGGVEALLHRSAADEQGCYRLTHWRVAAWITDLTLADDGATVSVVGVGLDPAMVEAEFVSKRGTVAGTVLPADSSGAFAVCMPFRHTRWGTEHQVVEAGSYWLRLSHRTTGDHLVPRLGSDLAARLPVDDLLHDVRVTAQVRARPEDTLAVVVKPPLRPDERGRRHQRALQELANHGTGRATSVFFRSLYGEAANDSAAAMHRELRRRGSGLTLLWSVQDLSVPVPEGGVAVVEGSKEWHRALGEAGHLVVNIHQPAWYRKPPDQVMVQTFHGYPYKGMGMSWWAKTDLPVSRVSSYLDRARDWDFLVSPSHYATAHLLREFFRPQDVAGVRVVEAGYPRNDVLLQPRGVEVRADTRRRLGIQDGQVAVLYAPTFRDEMSRDGVSAKHVDYLDLAAASAALGPGYVILMRGHAFHARAGEKVETGRDRVIDVTHYPDVAELCLASDAAVLDYSSLRFDYALTRKPMIFLVPDEEMYHRLRPAILPYVSTAPGPHVTTTREVVRLLRDVHGLRERYAGEVEQFLADYAELDDGHAAERVCDAVFGPAPTDTASAGGA